MFPKVAGKFETKEKILSQSGNHAGKNECCWHIIESTLRKGPPESVLKQ
jgi:hypothetical protein